MRADRPFVFTCLKDENGVAAVAELVLRSTGLENAVVG
jgi:hypothetical protein